MHLELPGFQSSLGEALFGCHTTNVVIKDEAGVEKWHRAGVLGTGRLVDGDVEGAAILFIPRHFNILQNKTLVIFQCFICIPLLSTLSYISLNKTVKFFVKTC